jgi:hypothetical protein
MEQVTPQWNGQWGDLGDMSNYAAGALTTRAWASAYYNMGTNRLGVKYAIDAFLCVPITTWKLRGLPDSYIRRDVTREPGGNPSDFQNDCRGCHAAMDAMGGAFAKLDFVENQFLVQAKGVAAKMNQKGEIYPAGFVTTDDSWINMLGNHPTVNFGWRGAMKGNGIHEFGEMLANSGAFSRCMVQKVFAEVCGQSIFEAAPDRLAPLTSDFESDGYNLKNLFGKVAIENACIPHMGDK